MGYERELRMRCIATVGAMSRRCLLNRVRFLNSLGVCGSRRVASYQSVSVAQLR